MGLLACGEGRKVAFWSTAELVSELRRANREGTTQDALRKLGRCDLIILDEWGYLPTDPDGARLLFRVVSMCYERIALILTTNIEFSRWGEIFADDDMAKAMMDRLCEASHKRSNAKSYVMRSREIRCTAWLRR